jgi:nicotinate phosphoribosyltransferase
MIRCVHPYDDKKRVNVIPSRVEPLLRLVWNESEGIVHKVPNLKETRDFVKDQLKAMRPDHIRNLNPTPYKVSVSQSLHSDMKKLWEDASPALELA